MTPQPWRDHVVTTLIALVSALFGTSLIMAVALLTDTIMQDGPEAAGSMGVAVTAVAWIFIGIGCYTAAVVMTNTFTTIIAGRVREIAQLRLLGATAGALRARLLVEGLVAGAIGTAVGTAVALLAYRPIVLALVAQGSLQDLPYRWVVPETAGPIAATLATVALAAWLGSRAISRVSPVEALAMHVEPSAERARRRPAQTAAMWILLVSGALLLVAGVLAGLVSPFGVLIAFLGGACSFTGVVVGASRIVPRLLSGVGRAFGRSEPVALARGNAVRSPRAATRSTIGMVIGVTLVVMFVVASATMRTITRSYISEVGDPAATAALETLLDVTTVVMIVLGGISAVLAAIGMVSNLSLSVIQRRREIGVLRAVGASREQVRAMITVESMLSSVVAIGSGCALGVLYGWAGAQATFGAAQHALVWPTVPWQLVAAVVAAAAVLGLVAAVAPVQRATRVAPIDALRVA